MANYLRFSVNFRDITESQKVEGGWNEAAFINRGLTNATVNNFLIEPGQSLSISGNVGEVCAEDWNVNFSGGSGLLNIVEKRYLV